MKKILFTALMQNNEKYLPYLHKCFKSVEKHNKKFKIDYLFYTNNNTDETENILKSLNYDFISENFSADFLNKYTRIEKLAIFRQKLLEKSKDKEFDYLVILDTDIFFNGRMIEEAMKIIISKDLEFTCLNSILNEKVPIHYDWLGSVVSENTKKMPIGKNVLIFIKTLIWNDGILKTDGFFNGVLIIKNTDIFKKKFNYILEDKKNIFCEHQIPNKKIKDSGVKFNILSGVTPIYAEKYKLVNSVVFKVKTDREKIYKDIYENVSKEKVNLKNRNIFILTVILILIISSLLLLKLKRLFIR